jgi:hypothetical protein
MEKVPERESRAAGRNSRMNREIAALPVRRTRECKKTVFTKIAGTRENDGSI